MVMALVAVVLVTGARGVSAEHEGEQAQREQQRAQRRHLKVVREGARAREGLGRSRGGLTSKIHLAADRRMRGLAHAISPGQRADPRGFDPVMTRLRILRKGPGRPRTRPDVVLGDKAYSSAGIRAHLRRRGVKAVIPVKDDQAAARAKKGSRGGRPPAFDADAYRDRNTVERAVARLKRFRAVALRTDKRLYVYNGTVTVAAISLWLRDLTRGDPSDTA